MGKWTVAGLCLLSAYAGSAVTHVVTSYATRDQTPTTTQTFKSPMTEIDFYLKRGERKIIDYHPSSGSYYPLEFKYEGVLNEKGDLSIYALGNLIPAKLGIPIEIGRSNQTGEKIELTPLETIAEGNNPQGIVHLKFSAPIRK